MCHPVTGSQQQHFIIFLKKECVPGAVMKSWVMSRFIHAFPPSSGQRLPYETAATSQVGDSRMYRLKESNTAEEKAIAFGVGPPRWNEREPVPTCGPSRHPSCRGWLWVLKLWGGIYLQVQVSERERLSYPEP